MFTQEVKESFVAQANYLAAQANQNAKAEYEQACRNWAENEGRTPKGKNKKPTPPTEIRPVVEFEPKFVLTMEETEIPVSAARPEDFLAKYGTDIGAIGGPVGGLIPGSTDRYYAASNATPSINEVYVSPAGDKYTYHRPTPFGGFWVRE